MPAVAVARVRIPLAAVGLSSSCRHCPAAATHSRQGGSQSVTQRVALSWSDRCSGPQGTRRDSQPPRGSVRGGAAHRALGLPRPLSRVPSGHGTPGGSSEIALRLRLLGPGGLPPAFAAASSSSIMGSAREEKPKVVLLHGLARTKGSMESLASYIEGSLGLECHCIGYPSMSLGLEELAEVAAASIRQAVGTEAEVWAVTHSMGGIVLRLIQGLPNTGGIQWRGSCLIAPPNRGSTVANFLSQVPYLQYLFHGIFGNSAVELGKLEDSENWPLPPAPCGVIAGTRSLALSNPTSWMTYMLGLLTGESDGTVHVNETKLPENAMTDFVCVPTAHTFMMYDQAVMQLVVSFLSDEHFGGGRIADGFPYGEATRT